jgi:PTS system nitrogen regulatory IIA component
MSAQTTHFGATLRLLRVESGLSLRDLARRLGVSGAYLSRVENGLDATPTPARLEAMARELDIPATLLMDLAHRMSPLVVDYVQQVPEAGTLFLEIAHRRLDATQIAELAAVLEERFPRAKTASRVVLPRLSDIISPDRIILHLACSDIEDVLDVAAGRLADPSVENATLTIALELKKRESEASSAIGGGVAVPRAYVAGAAPAAALITLATPLPYDTPDGEPLRLVIVLLGAGGSDRLIRLVQIARLAARGLAERLAPMDSAAQILSRLELLEALR